jgi:hypothetical protein
MRKGRQEENDGSEGNPEQVWTSQKGGTFRDLNKIPRAIWSHTGERNNISKH